MTFADGIEVRLGHMLEVAGGVLIAVGVLAVLAILFLGIIGTLDNGMSGRWSQTEEKGCMVVVIVAVVSLVFWLFG